MLELNDEAAAAVRGVELEGWVRLGLQEDFAEQLLPAVLARFARAHPKVRVEVRVGRNADLVDRVAAGTLDLALAWNDGTLTGDFTVLTETPMRWIGPSDGSMPWHPDSGEPVPLASLEAPCIMRSAATKALDAAGISWRLTLVSPSLAGLWAAAGAGLGYTIRTSFGLPDKVKPVPADEIPFPVLPKLGLVLMRASADQSPATRWLETAIANATKDLVS